MNYSVHLNPRFFCMEMIMYVLPASWDRFFLKNHYNYFELSFWAKISYKWVTKLNSLLCCWCCLIAQSYLTLCDPMDCSMLGFPVLHYHPEFAQTQVPWVDDAIQPSHPLLLPSPAINLSQLRVFSNESVLHIQWPKHCSFSFSISPSNEYSRLISFSTD